MKQKAQHLLHCLLHGSQRVGMTLRCIHVGLLRCVLLILCLVKLVCQSCDSCREGQKLFALQFLSCHNLARSINAAVALRTQLLQQASSCLSCSTLRTCALGQGSCWLCHAVGWAGCIGTCMSRSGVVA